MCAPLAALAIPLTIGSAALTAAGTVAAGIQARQQGKYESQVADINAQMASQARREAIDKGVTDQVREDRKAAQLQGAQRVALAGSGVDTTFGTAADIAGDTALISSENRHDNALATQRTADGYAIQGWNDRAQGAAAKPKGQNAFGNSLFSAGGTILGAAAQVGKYKAGYAG